jgi:superfamily II DNA or RNA helicase
VVEVQRRARDQSLTSSDLRTLLFVPIGGPGVSAARRTALDFVICNPQLARPVLWIHVQSTGLPAPVDRVRLAPSSTGPIFEAQVSLVINGRTVVSRWHKGQTKKAAKQRAHVDLITQLTEVPKAEAKRDAAPSEGPTPAAANSGVLDVPAPHRAVDDGTSDRTIRPAIAPRIRLREAPGAAPLPTVVQALCRGAGLVFDPGTAAGQAAFLCVLPDGQGGARKQPGSISSTLLLPGGELARLDCLRADLLELLPVLAGIDEVAWSDSTRLWSRVVRLALRMISQGRVLPTVAEARDPSDRQPTWRIGPVTAAMRDQVEAFAEELLLQPQRLRLDDQEGEEPDDPMDAVSACLDAVADRFVPAPGFRHLLGPVPFAAHVHHDDPITPLQDWADSIEDELDTEPAVPMILRIPEPHGDRPKALYVTLRLATLPDSPDTAVDAASVWTRREDFPGSSFDLRRRVARALRSAAAVFFPLRPLGAQPHPEALILTLGEVAELRGRAAQELLRAGIAVEWHKGWAADLSAHVLIGTGSAVPVGQGGFGLGEVLDRRWQITLDGVALTDDEMDYLAVQALPHVRLHNRWVLLDEDIRYRLRHRRLPPITARQGLLDALSSHATIDGATYACTTAGGLTALMDKLCASDEQLKASPAPVGLRKTTLHAYQQSGLNWLNRLTALGFGALLADDMGTGKTIIAIAFHLCRQSLNLGPTLVLCPTGLFQKWEKEVALHAPEVNVIRYHGPRRSLAGIKRNTIVLTNYELLCRDSEDLTARSWGLVIADEAQKIKNSETLVAQVARTLPAGARLALTGTPMENRADELWCLLDWCNPELFGTRQHFIAGYARPIERATTPEETEAARARLQQLLRPFIRRRLKTDPTLGLPLPPKQEITHTTALSKEQIGLLEGLMRDTQHQLRTCPGRGRYGELVLKLILGDRKICISPAHYKEEDFAACAADPDEAARRAPKLAKLDQLLRPVRERGERALVFTNFAVADRLIAAYLDARGYRTLVYDGSLNTPRKKKAVLDAFSAGEADVLVLTLQSGGVGLDIPHANHVIHYDRHWNPASEAQANDRVHRIGQKRDVHIHYLVSAGSIEERMAAMIERKRGLADAFLPTGELDYDKISADEIIALCTATPRP